MNVLPNACNKNKYSMCAKEENKGAIIKMYANTARRTAHEKGVLTKTHRHRIITRHYKTLPTATKPYLTLVIM